MPDLTEERKQQIRDEEAAKFRRLQQEEQLFREQVRRELELASHVEVAPLPSPPPATLSEPKFDIGPTVRPSKTQPQSSSSKRAVFFAVLLGVLGVGFMAYAARSGFRLPRFGQGQDIALKADSSGELVDLDAGTMPEGPKVAPAKTAQPRPTPTQPPISKKPAPSIKTPSVRKSPSGSSTTPSGPKRIALRGEGISLAVPSGWKAQQIEEAVELKPSSAKQWDDPYVMLRTHALDPGEDLAAFAARMEHEVILGAGDPPPTIEDRRSIANFQGLPARIVLLAVSTGDSPNRRSLLLFIRSGKGYCLTCFARPERFAGMAGTFEQIMMSTRFGEP